jgi:hypothetical protein
MRHLMIDLETLGLNPHRAPILQIGAVEFDESFTREGFASGQYEYFCASISIKSSLDAGRVVEPETVRWWQSQSCRETLDKSSSGGGDFFDVLESFLYFLMNTVKIRNDVKVWSHGSLDLRWLENAYFQADQNRPNAYKMPFWNYSAVRDCRTVLREFGDVVAAPDQFGNSHDALNDAVWQAEYVAKIMRWKKEKMR